MGFIGFFSNGFGYVLNFIYEIIKNYGVSIILFSIILKVIMIPISTKQHISMKKTAKIQGKLKNIQKKYKGNQEKINQETMALYKQENMSPFSGCLSAIIQLVLLLAMFYLVRSPLTYMKKIDSTEINKMSQQIVKEIGQEKVSAAYPEISIVKYVNDNNLKDSKFYINMNFLGLDLSNIPKENWQNWKVYIIPILYILSSIASMRLMSKMNSKKDLSTKGTEDIIITENKEIVKPENEDMASQMNKNMMWLMPIMSVTISLIAPLGLAMYWLINNILIIIEKLILNKVLEPKEDENK